MANEVTTKSKTGITAYLTNDAVKRNIASIVSGKSGERFVASVVSAVETNPALQQCTNKSVLSAALLGQSLNLSPSPQLGHYYMVPYTKKAKYGKNGEIITPEVTEAQFQMVYKGYIQLATRSGQYKKLNVLAIKEGELVKFDPLDEEIEVRLIEDEEQREQAKTIGYYAMFEYVNGFKKAMYWSKKKMLCHADRYSQAFSKDATEMTVKGRKKTKVSFEDYEAGKYPESDAWMYSSFWYKDFDGMAYKTMLRQLISKWGIMSIDIEKAYEADMAVISEKGNEYVDNLPEEETETYVDSTVSEGAMDAFAGKAQPDGQQQLDLGGEADGIKQ